MSAINQQDDIDNQIPNQQIALIQFFEPDDTVKQKRDVFFFQKFVNDFVKQQQETLEQISQLYPDFTDKLNGLKKKFLYLDNTDLIHDQYENFVDQNFKELVQEYQSNDTNNVTSLTHIKIRGCYPDLESAKNKILEFQQQRKQPFNTYGIQVGQWQPLLPPELSEQQQYTSQEQQQLMNKIKDNQQKKDEIFNQYISNATQKSNQQHVKELDEFKYLDNDAKNRVFNQQPSDDRKQKLIEKYKAMGLQ